MYIHIENIFALVKLKVYYLPQNPLKISNINFTRYKNFMTIFLKKYLKY